MTSSPRAGVCRVVRRALAIAETVARRARTRAIWEAPPDSETTAPTTDGAAGWGDPLSQRILSTIHNNSILLCGGSPADRSAFLLHLKNRLLSMEDPVYRFFPVYVELDRVPERRFFGILARSITDELGSPPAPRPPSPTLNGPVEYTHRSLTRDLRSTVQQLSAHTPRHVKLVLLVDGIEALETYHPRTSQRLRGLFMTNLADHLVMVASASAISRRWDREGSPWYNFFEEICLPQGPGR